MKKITIPKCRNPFVVILNGIRYEYESGQEIEVPKAVAEIIENHVDSKPKAKPIGLVGGLCNRPHVYLLDNPNKLPTDAIDGSLAIVEDSYNLKGKWEWNETIDQASMIDGVHLIECRITAGIESRSYFYFMGLMMDSSNGVVGYLTDLPDNYSDLYDGDWYYTREVEFLEDTDSALLRNFVMDNAKRLSSGYALYSRINGEWVYESEVDFTDLASV